LEQEWLKLLSKKSSRSGRNLEVIKVKDLEEATRQGIETVFSIDYREERGEYKRSDVAIGYSTDFFCTIKRADANRNITSNWDNLQITKLGKEVDLSYKSDGQPGQLRVSFTFEGAFAEGLLRQLTFGFFDSANDLPPLKIIVCPTITSITPTSGPLGAKVMIKGKDLADVTTVKFTNDARASFTVDSDTQISLIMLANARGGEIAVTQDGCPLVWTPAFTLLESPVPTVTSLSPASATAGGADMMITLTGSNFIPGSVIRWNDNGRATQFVNETQLTAQIPAADVASVGKAMVTAFNPAPGGGASTALDFTINPPPNPTPTLSNLSPDVATAGNRDLTLTITGANFINASVVQWNGQDQATTFVNDTQLTTQIPASSLAKAVAVTVRVFTPAPGGGASNEMSFTINRKQPQAQTRGQGRKTIQRPSPRPTKKR
jgi:hypothetical protein